MKYVLGFVLVCIACSSRDTEQSIGQSAEGLSSSQLEQPAQRQRQRSEPLDTGQETPVDARRPAVKVLSDPPSERLKTLTPYRNIRTTSASVQTAYKLEEFAGANACKSCHRDIYNEWSKSTHGLAGGMPNSTTIVAPFDGTPMTFADAVVIPRKSGKRYFFEVKEENAASITMDVVGVVGRGLMKGGGTQVFLNRASDGRVLMLPFDYSVTDQKWFCQAKRGQGWEQIDKELSLRDCEWPPWRGLGITGGPNCQNCHASQIEVTWQGMRGDFVTRWKSLTIDCESCHGPARAHVNAKKTNSAGGTMQTLKGLEAQDSLDLCFRCHATKSVTGPGYQSGQDFNAHFSHTHMMDPQFSSLDEHGRVREFAYQEGHLSSPCYAQGAMVCTDCHTPHGLKYQDVLGRPLSNWEDDRQCTGCHVGVSVLPKLHGKHPSDVRCVQCHMPYLQHPGVGAEVTYARSDHRISRPVEWRSGRALAGAACQSCHSWNTDLERVEALSSIYGKVRPTDKRLADLQRLEAFELEMGYLRADKRLGPALSLFAKTLDWPVPKRIRSLTSIGKLLLVPGVRQLTTQELNDLGTLSVASPFEVKAAGGGLLLLLSDVQPEAGAHFDRLVSTIPIHRQIGFRRTVAFNLVGLWMSYGFSNRTVTEKLVRVIRRFAPQLESDGPRIDVFAGRTLGSVGATEASFQAYLDALSDPVFYGTPIPLDKGGEPRRIFAEMKSRFLSEKPALITGLLERLPVFLANEPENMMLRCGAFEAKQLLQQALDCVTRIVEENPRNVSGHFKRADLLLKLRRQAQAVEALEKGLAIDPDDREAKDLYRFLKMKSWEKAR
ncbi:MAG: ammonia-forming cytochrome c nitrite reductase subunit c552 [Bradymonadia bacterium]